MAPTRPAGEAQVGDEAGGIARRRRKLRLVVEGDVSMPMGAADPAIQGGLATLTRSMNQDHRRVGERLLQKRPNERLWLVQMKGYVAAE